MTKQESKILEIIKNNPTIEQAEIASLLNISRSTVAVHISSLIKQGYITGKGYILGDDNDNYVLGIGAANVDIYGKSTIKIKTHYDHPANISSNVGGVTKNILTNLSKLGANTKLMTALGDDSYKDIILKNCETNNIDTKDCLIVKGKSSSVFMQIQDENNDMYLALCDMSALESITPTYLNSKANTILNSKLVVFDPSLSDNSIKALIKLCKDKVALYADPVSDNYALKMKEYVPQLTCIKPNRTELENISDTKIKDDSDLVKACTKLLGKGLKKIYVSLSKDGLLYMDRDGNKIKKKLKPVKNMVNASGAGDALMAGIIYGELNNLDIHSTIDYGLAAGIAAITCKETVNENLCVDLLNKILKENK